jgi:MFS family permease
MISKWIANLRQIPKAVLYLSIASLFGDIASEAIYPILPLFLTQTLGVSVLYIGALEGVAEAIASLTKLASGYLSDRTQKKSQIVLVGYILSLGRSFIGLATTPTQILAIRFSDRFGKGIRTAPRDAWLARYTTPQTRGKIFGFHRGMDNLGATIAPLLATLFLYFYPGRYRLLFLLTLIPGIWTISYIIKAIQAGKETPASIEIPKEKISFRSAIKLPRNFWYLLFVIFIFTLSNSADAFLLLRLKDVGVPVYLIPTLWAGFNLVKMVSSFWGGGFSDRVGARTSIILGWLIYAAAYLCFAKISNPYLMASIFLGYGVFFGLTEAPEKSFVTSLVPAHLRGTAFGFYHLVVGVGLLPASLLCGYLWKEFDAPTAFFVSALLAFASVILLLPLRENKMKRELYA